MFLTRRLEEALMDKIEADAKKRGIKLKYESQEELDDIIEEYFKTHPKMEKQFEAKMKHLKKVERAIVTGTLVAGTLMVAGGLKIHSEIKERQNERIESQMDAYRESIEQNNQKEEKEQTPEEKYTENLKEELEANRNEDFVNTFRKEIIVDQYNKENPENKISVDDLKIYESNPQYVIATMDKLGNIVSYNNHLITKEESLEENQKLVNNMKLYIYKINDETVAIYDASGTPVMQDGQSFSDNFFKDTVNLVSKSIDLRNAYQYSEEFKYEEKEENFAKAAYEFEQIRQNSREQSELEI